MTTIKIYKKNVWGNDLIYIKDEKEAEAMRKLTGRKTINASDIRTLEALGFDFEYVLN